MRVLHVNYADFGGAGIAAGRLNEALCEQGVDSRMIVRLKRGADVTVDVLTGKEALFAKIRVSIAHRMLNALGFSLRSMSLFPSGLQKRIEAYQPDILHLHWVNGELLSITDLPRFNIPTVWTLHDMWAFCGAEHCATDNRYVEGYTKESYQPLATSHKLNIDLDRWVFRRKQKAWKNWHPSIVTCSNWLRGCAHRSVLFENLSIQTIPNCIDLDIFKPMDQMTARMKVNLPLDKKLILFGAFDITQSHKGMDLLVESLTNLPPEEKKQYECVVFGASGDKDVGGIKTTWLGRIDDPVFLSQIYAAVDLLACPSRIDNLPNTCVEAQACGTPVVAFDIGGLSDIVVQKKTGYLAKPFDVKDFAEGIVFVLEQRSDGLKLMRMASRKNAEQKYMPETVARRYKALYEDILSGGVESH